MNENHPATDGFRRVTITELRNYTSRIIDEVVATGTPVTITRYGKPVAVLSPLDYFDRRFLDRLAATLTGQTEAPNG